MIINIGWWIIPAVMTLLLGYKAWPKDDKYTSGNFSHFDIDNFFRLFWLIPIGFIWAVFFAVKYYAA